jgi:hypothetical protein
LFGIIEDEGGPAFYDTSRLFKRGELVRLARGFLAEKGPLDTRQLALMAIKAKGMNGDDMVLRWSVAFRLVQALRLRARRGLVVGNQKQNGVRVWEERSR